MEMESDDATLYNDDSSLDDGQDDRELRRERCGAPHGLMIAGIVGAIVSVTVSAPLAALCCLTVWGAGAAMEMNKKLRQCCAKYSAKTD